MSRSAIRLLLVCCVLKCCVAITNGARRTSRQPQRPDAGPAAGCWCVRLAECAAAASAPAELLRAASCGFIGKRPFVCCDVLAAQTTFTQRPPPPEDNDIGHDAPPLSQPDIEPHSVRPTTTFVSSGYANEKHTSSASDYNEHSRRFFHGETSRSRHYFALTSTTRSTLRVFGSPTTIRDRNYSEAYSPTVSQGRDNKKHSDVYFSQRDRTYFPHNITLSTKYIIRPTPVPQKVHHLSQDKNSNNTSGEGIYTNNNLFPPVHVTVTENPYNIYNHGVNSPRYTQPSRHVISTNKQDSNCNGDFGNDCTSQKSYEFNHRVEGPPRRLPQHNLHTAGFFPHLFPPKPNENPSGSHHSLPPSNIPHPLPLLPPGFHKETVTNSPHTTSTEYSDDRKSTTRKLQHPTSTSTTDDDAIVFPGPVENWNRGTEGYHHARTPHAARTPRPQVERTTSALNPRDEHKDHPNRRLLPTDCGVDVENRIVGGKEAHLGQFPWIARIGYVSDGSQEVVFRCGGALISSLYVITAAHCVTGLPGGLQLAAVRLGELDARTEPDCEEGMCADPTQQVAVAEARPHPLYDSVLYSHDVALLRLAAPANITPYVGAICLPFGELSTRNYTGQKAVVAGWGATEDGSGSPQLRWARVTVTDPGQCSEAYRKARISVSGDGQLCAGGPQDGGADSCDGDSGGPLSRPEQPEDGVAPPAHVLIGAVSFGSRLCGAPGIPGVYTRVAAYLTWILDSLRP